MSPKPATPVAPVTLSGRYCRLEPLLPMHARELYAATAGEGEAERYRYLLSTPPADAGELAARIKSGQGAHDQLDFAVIDTESGICRGRQAFMRMRPQHGSVEIGAILWGRGATRTRVATEALYLFAAHVFEDLGHRRFEWKCNAENRASRRAAERFGFTFEGIFRQDMIIKGANRDTAWFSMIDGEWPGLKARFDVWLDPANFDKEGNQLRRLKDC